MSRFRVVPTSPRSEPEENLKTETVLRDALIPVSGKYLDQVVPRKTEKTHCVPDVEAFSSTRIDLRLGLSQPNPASLNATYVDRREIDFIPTDLARSFLLQIQSDARDLDRRYREMVKELDRNYGNLEEEMKRKYAVLVGKTQMECNEKIDFYKNLLETAGREFREYKEKTGEIVDILKGKIREFDMEKKKLVSDLMQKQEKFRAENENLREKHKQEIDSFRTKSDLNRQKLQEKVDILEADLRKKDSEIVTFRAKSDSNSQKFESEIENLSTKLKEKDSEIATFRLISEAKSHEIAQISLLTETLHTLETEKTHLQQENSHLIDIFKTHNCCEIDISRLLIDNMVLNIELLDGKNNLQKELGGIVVEIIEKKNELKKEENGENREKLEREVQELGRKAENLGCNLDFSDTGETQKALNSALFQLQKLQNDLISTSSDHLLKDLLASKTDQISNLQAQIQHFEDLFAPSNSAEDALVAALKEKLTLTNSELTDSQILIEKLREKVAELETELGKLTENEGKIVNLESKLEKMEKIHMQEKGNFRGEIEKYIQKTEETEAKNRLLDLQLQEIDTKMTAERAEFRKIQDDLSHLGRLKIEHSQLAQEIAELRLANQVKESELKENVRMRKALHNEVQDMKGKIRVYCRARPMNSSEISRKSNEIVSFPDEFSIKCEMKNGQMKEFRFDSVFGAGSRQEEVFEETKGVVQSAVDGYNVCVFAYGQTGSGKTFTMQGTPEQPGVTPRAFHELFTLLNRLPDHYRWKVSCYMVELYLDTLIDLFRPNSRRETSSLVIKKDFAGVVEIPGVTIVEVHSPEDLLRRFEQGEMQRHTESTKMNDTSSRSHLVFSVFVDVDNLETHQRTLGKLSLVDLAGSERVSKAESSDDRLREGRAINKSLTALGDVIAALSSGESHIPYRNNKLTMLMSDSLGGTAKTLMFVNVSPSSYNREETLMSLFYASRVKLITNDPFKNLETKEQSRLKDALLRLQVKKAKYKQALLTQVSPAQVTELLLQPLQEALPNILDDSSDDLVQSRLRL